MCSGPPDVSGFLRVPVAVALALDGLVSLWRPLNASEGDGLGKSNGADSACLTCVNVWWACRPSGDG